MLWVKSLHVIFMVTWFAGLFYLPRLFVYHAMVDDASGEARLRTMERKLFVGIMTPGAVLTLVFGAWLLVAYWPAYLHTGWMQAKLWLVALLILYHAWCGVILRRFAHGGNTRSHFWYRWFNEIPVLLLAAIVILVVVKPF